MQANTDVIEASAATARKYGVGMPHLFTSAFNDSSHDLQTHTLC